MRNGPPEDLVEAERSLNDAVIARRPGVPILLLGPGGGHLELRAHVSSDLNALGYRSVVMEEYEPILGESLFEKWERMLAQVRPRLYVFIVPRDAMIQGPHVEFGYLLHRDRPDGLRDRARFFLETAIEADAALAYYEIEYIGRAGNQFFGTRDQLTRRIARTIDSVILSGLE